jgi:hypothetical protein
LCKHCSCSWLPLPAPACANAPASCATSWRPSTPRRCTHERHTSPLNPVSHVQVLQEEAATGNLSWHGDEHNQSRDASVHSLVPCWCARSLGSTSPISHTLSHASRPVIHTVYFYGAMGRHSRKFNRTHDLGEAASPHRLDRDTVSCCPPSPTHTIHFSAAGRTSNAFVWFRARMSQRAFHSAVRNVTNGAHT